MDVTGDQPTQAEWPAMYGGLAAAPADHRVADLTPMLARLLKATTTGGVDVDAVVEKIQDEARSATAPLKADTRADDPLTQAQVLSLVTAEATQLVDMLNSPFSAYGARYGREVKGRVESIHRLAARLNDTTIVTVSR